MGILDLFRGSKDEQIAKRFISMMRALGETRRLECNHSSKPVFSAMT